MNTLNDAPDYLREAEGAIRRDPLSRIEDISAQSFSELQDHNPELLRHILIAALSVPNGMTRKSAAFALGQVGDSDKEVIEALNNALKLENTKGNIEAIEAALRVLTVMPQSSGSTDLQRRKAIENAYFGRPLDSATSSPYAQTPPPKGWGCFSLISLILLTF